VRARLATQPATKADERRRSLTINEIRMAAPIHLHPFLDKCDMTGCDTDIWGMPLCLTSDERAMLLPYVQEGLKKINGGH
jgi:hypothetical protein